MNYSNVFLFAGQYDDLDQAQMDYDSLSAARKRDAIGPFQAAIFEKRSDGKVKVLDTTSTTRATGAKWGAAIGAGIGLLFPPAILISAAQGAALGALGGNLSKGWFKGDVKRIADELEPGQAGIVAIAEAGETLETEAVFARATRTESEMITGEDAEMMRERLEAEATANV